jgi:hypothetical protein
MSSSKVKKLLMILVGILLVASCSPSVLTELPFITSAPPERVSPTSQPSAVSPTAQVTSIPSDLPFVLPGGRLLFGAVEIGPTGSPEYEFFSWLQLPDMTIEAHQYLTGAHPFRDYSMVLSPDLSHLAFAHQTFSGPGEFLLVEGETVVHLAGTDDAEVTPIGQPFSNDYIPYDSVNGDGISWSANGHVFAFARINDWESFEEEKHLYLHDVPSRTSKTLTIRTPQPNAFALSPDGTQVAFTDLGANPGLSLINADGSNQRVLVEGWVSSNLVWHPEGERIFFVMDKPPIAIYSADVSTGAITPVIERGEDPFLLSLSPDGSLLAYEDQGFCIVSADGGEPLKLLPDGPGYHGWVWSPDSQYLAYTAPPANSIYVINRLGHGRVEVYHNDKFRVPRLIGWLP